MNRSIRACIGVILALTLLLAAPVHAKPCGSDGPVPFLNMTGSITLPVKQIQSVGAIQEFAYWETQEALVYRNDANQLRVSYFGSSADTPLADLKFPLSKLVDASERYLTTDEAPLFLDASKADPFIRYTKGKAPLKLFWENKDLFVLRYHAPVFNYPYYEVGRYTAGGKTTKSQCEFTPPAGQELYLAEGHAYPDVFFYQLVPLNGGNFVAFYKMNVLTCDVKPVGFPTELIEGKILGVHRFAKDDAFVVRIDHPTKNFRWEQQGRCEYLGFGQETVMIPNHDRPLAVTWSPGQGLSLYNLETKKKADALASRNLGIKDLTSRDIFIPRRQSALLLSPEMEAVKSRRMMSVDVEEILPVACH